MALCHITGTVQLPDGTNAAGRILVFKRNPETVVAQSGHGIVPDEIAVKVAADGTVDFKLYTGNYIGFLRNQRAGNERVFEFPVPEASTALFQDILQAVDPVEPLPSWLTEAFEARDDALEAELAAEDAADRAAANAALVKPQFDSVAQLQSDTAMTDATVPVGGTVSVNDVGGYVRVASGGEILTAGGMYFTKADQSSSIDSAQLGLLGLTDCLPAINDALTRYGSIRLMAGSSVSFYDIGGVLNIPDGKSVILDENACIRMMDAPYNTSTRVVRLNSNSRLIGGTVSGNHAARKASGFTGPIWACEMVGIGGEFSPNLIVDIGKGTSDEVGLEDGGAVITSINVNTATKNVSGNKAHGFHVEGGDAGFILRMHSQIRGTQESDCPYHVQDNDYFNITSNGGSKNLVELAGCNVRENRVTNVTCSDPTSTCTTAFESDYGSYGNRFENCTMVFNSTSVQSVSTFNVLSSRGGDTGDGYIKITRGNSFVNCGVIGGVWGNRLNIMVQRDQAHGTKYINTFAKRISKHSSGGDTTIVAYYEEFNLIDGTDAIIESPNIDVCDVMVRRWSTKKTNGISINGGMVNTISRTYNDEGDGYLVKFKVGGGIILNQVGDGIRPIRTFLVDIDGVEFRGSTTLNIARLPLIVPEMVGSVMRFGNNFVNCPDQTTNSALAGSGNGSDGYFLDVGGNVFANRGVQLISRGDYGRAHISGNDYVSSYNQDFGMPRDVMKGVVFSANEPTSGNWWVGDEVVNGQPSAGSIKQRTCVLSGTAGTSPAGVTASGLVGETEVTLSSTSGFNIGNFIRFGASSTPYRITGVNSVSGVISIGTPLSASISGESVSFRNPTWKIDYSLPA